jgi:molybdate transport system regulatory protein
VRRVRLHPRLRITSGPDIVLGPGKADLLEAIARTGSIREAAAELEMSYNRAWGLIHLMNESFREPVVEAVRGGSDRGGAKLTRAGRTVIRLYRRMTADSARASGPAFRELRKLLK